MVTFTYTWCFFVLMNIGSAKIPEPELHTLERKNHGWSTNPPPLQNPLPEITDLMISYDQGLLTIGFP